MSLSDLPKLLRTSVKPLHKYYLCTGFTEVLNNFGKSDNDLIYLVKTYSGIAKFDAQLDQKILDGLYHVVTLALRPVLTKQAVAYIEIKCTNPIVLSCTCTTGIKT